MGILKNLLEKLRTKKAQESAMMDEVHVQKRVLERQKNANERELERYYEEARQKQIASKLSKLRKQKTREIMTTNNFTNNKYLFKDKCYLGRYY